MPCIAGVIGEGGAQCYFIALKYPEFLIQFVQTDDDQRREKGTVKRLKSPNPSCSKFIRLNWLGHNTSCMVAGKPRSGRVWESCG